MAGHVGEAQPVPRVIEPVGTGRVEAPKVPINPRNRRHGRHPEAEDGENAGDGDKDEETSRDPYGARDDDQGGEEDEAEDGGGEGEAGEEEENAAGDYEGGESDELGEWSRSFWRIEVVGLGLIAGNCRSAICNEERES